MIIKGRVMPGFSVGKGIYKRNNFKLIGETLHGDRIVAEDRITDFYTTMSLLPGFILPAGVKRPKIEKLQEVYIKISPKEGLDQEVIRERDFLLELSGLKGVPNVLAYGKVEIKDDGGVERRSPFFVMPKIPGEILDNYGICNWKEEASREKLALLLTELLPALAENLARLHDKNVVHRDVKPDNAMFDAASGLLTLLDFGRANWLNAESPRTDVGAFGFYPPELEFNTPKKEDKRTDMYGFGVTCYVLLTGKDGVIYRNLKDPWSINSMDFMFIDRDMVMERYYLGIRKHGGLTIDELVSRTVMPRQLKRSAIGRYLVRLFHPHKGRRPSNMWKVARNLRRLGGQFVEHEIQT